MAVTFSFGFLGAGLEAADTGCEAASAPSLEPPRPLSLDPELQSAREQARAALGRLASTVPGLRALQQGLQAFSLDGVDDLPELPNGSDGDSGPSRSEAVSDSILRGMLQSVTAAAMSSAAVEAPSCPNPDLVIVGEQQEWATAGG